VPVLSWIIKSPTGTIVSEQKNWKENIEAEAMKLFRNLFFTLVLPCSLSSFAANAQYENMSPQGLVDELATTLNLTRETEAAINANLVIKQEYEREKANYDRDVEAYNTVLRRFNAEVERYDTECNRQLSVAELNACKAWKDELAPEKVNLDQRL
jgi:hypothetical protein